jgi:hypothetical protein
MNARAVYRIWALKRNEWCAKRSDERGIALITVILLIMVLSFVSAAAIVTSTTELKIGGNFKTSVQSLYNAEAGVQYALGQIRNMYAAGTLDLTGNPVVVHYGAPNTAIYPLLSNGKFPFSSWSTTRLYPKTGTTADYWFQTTGNYSNSKTLVKVLLHMPTPILTPGMSAGGSITIGNSFTLNGAVASGSTVTYGGGGTSINGSVTQNATIVADPLDSVTMVSNHNYSAVNNNANALPTPIGSNSISGSKILPPGNYYLTNLTNGNLTISGSGTVNIYLNDNTVTLDNITINPGSGPVNIYYHGTGTFTAGNNSNINNGGNAGNLSIICDTAATFDFNNNLGFSGLLYAPYANVVFGNSANFTGVLRANTVSAGNSLTFTYSAPNPAIAGSMSSTPILVSWKQL